MTRNVLVFLAAVPIAAMAFPTLPGHASAVPLLPPSFMPPSSMPARTAPTADLRLYSHTAHTVWDGSSDAWDTIDLCLASNTGRYRLRIDSQSGGALTGPGKLHYTLSLIDGAGVSHDVTLQDQVQVTIEGQAPIDATCDRGPNATLRLRAAQNELLKGQAGRYLDRLRLAIDPL